MVPTTIQEEQKASKAFYEEHGKCVFCDIIEREAKGPRLFLKMTILWFWLLTQALTRWSSGYIPKKHAPNILNLTAGEISAFAKTLKTSLKALKDLVNDPPYNYGIHLAINPDAQDSYHWHLEVYPKLATWAGFEKSTGIYINTVTPETAAESLRKAIKP